jgi:hypothetical protein
LSKRCIDPLAVHYVMLEEVMGHGSWSGPNNLTSSIFPWTTCTFRSPG